MLGSHIRFATPGQKGERLGGTYCGISVQPLARELRSMNSGIRTVARVKSAQKAQAVRITPDVTNP